MALSLFVFLGLVYYLAMRSCEVVVGEKGLFIENTEEVERLIAAQRIEETAVFAPIDRFKYEERWRRQDELERQPEKYMPTRKEFVSAMNRHRAIPVANASGEFIGSEGPICTTDGLYGRKYQKVRITRGPYRGRVGWVCEREIGFPHGCF